MKILQAIVNKIWAIKNRKHLHRQAAEEELNRALERSEAARKKLHQAVAASRKARYNRSGEYDPLTDTWK